MSCSDIFLGLIAILFPPIAVWIKSGLCSADSLINILLCMLGYIPGLLHAWYIIAKYPEVDHDYESVDAESGRQRRQGRVTYYYVSQNEQQQGSTGGGQQQRVYGTTTQGSANKVSSGGNKQQNRVQGRQPQPQQSGNAGPSSSEAHGNGGPSDGSAPPSYQEVVRGDNKIQTQD